MLFIVVKLFHTILRLFVPPLKSLHRVNSNTTLINQFEQNIIAFYDVERSSFMKDKRVGDHETYYLHCLRFYIPKMS